MLKFSAIDDVPRVWGAETAITLPWLGKEKVRQVNFRIDGRKPGCFRVDVHEVAIWVAIDGGPDEAPTTFKEAVAIASRYAQAMRDQKTWSPSFP